MQNRLLAASPLSALQPGAGPRVVIGGQSTTPQQATVQIENELDVLRQRMEQLSFAKSQIEYRMAQRMSTAPQTYAPGSFAESRIEELQSQEVSMSTSRPPFQAPQGAAVQYQASLMTPAMQMLSTRPPQGMQSSEIMPAAVMGSQSMMGSQTAVSGPMRQGSPPQGLNYILPQDMAKLSPEVQAFLSQSQQGGMRKANQYSLGSGTTPSMPGMMGITGMPSGGMSQVPSGGISHTDMHLMSSGGSLPQMSPAGISSKMQQSHESSSVQMQMNAVPQYGSSSMLASNGVPQFGGSIAVGPTGGIQMVPVGSGTIQPRGDLPYLPQGELPFTSMKEDGSYGQMVIPPPARFAMVGPKNQVRVERGEEGLRLQHSIQAPTIQTAVAAAEETSYLTRASATDPRQPDASVITNDLDARAFTPLRVGDPLPPAHIDLHGVCVNLQEFFEERSGILFGLVGAFHPIDTKKSVPGILAAMESFERLVDFVGCLVVNDPFVVKAWAKKLGVSDQFTFVADSDAKFTKALGMAVVKKDEGLGLRCRRFAAVIGPRAKIRWMGFDDESLAENVLVQLPKYVRTPWKSFIVAIGYQKKAKKQQTSDAGREPVLEGLESMRQQLQAQGFCSETDWQLVLSDQMTDVFKPTRENILSGLKWLVEGSQAGDVLCFYFAGRGGRVVMDDGTEVNGLLPMDNATADLITEKELYDILVPHVPEACRLTIILDTQSDVPITCPLKYLYDASQQKCSSSVPDVTGEVLCISYTGRTPVPTGTLARLLGAQEKEESLSIQAKIERMNASLRDWNFSDQSVAFGSTVRLDTNDEFTLSDVLVRSDFFVGGS